MHRLAFIIIVSHLFHQAAVRHVAMALISKRSVYTIRLSPHNLVR